MWNRQSKSQSTVKEKLDEVQEIQNINARDNVAEPDAFEGKELTKKEQKKLEEKLAEAVASTGQDEQNHKIQLIDHGPFVEGVGIGSCRYAEML